MQPTNLTPIESTKRELYNTRLAMIQQSRLALHLLEEKTVRQATELDAAIAARLQAEAAAVPPVDGAEIVELRRGGPVPADETASAGTA